MTKSTGAIASLTLALVLVGCSAAGESDVNAADERFVTRMIPHHEQALEMADILLDKDGVDGRVAELAERIQAAQQPEIDLMTSWLEEWGVDPDTDDMGDMGDMPGMDHGDDGMMSPTTSLPLPPQPGRRPPPCS